MWTVGYYDGDRSNGELEFSWCQYTAVVYAQRVDRDVDHMEGYISLGSWVCVMDSVCGNFI